MSLPPWQRPICHSVPFTPKHKMQFDDIDDTQGGCQYRTPANAERLTSPRSRSLPARPPSSSRPASPLSSPRLPSPSSSPKLLPPSSSPKLPPPPASLRLRPSSRLPPLSSLRLPPLLARPSLRLQVTRGLRVLVGPGLPIWRRVTSESQRDSLLV